MKHLFLVNYILLFISFNAASQINMDCGGNVSIGNTTPDTYTFKIRGTTRIITGTSTGIIIDNNGYSNNPAIYGGTNLGLSTRPWYVVYSDNFLNPSDRRLKENITNLNNTLDLIMKLNSVKFDYTLESNALKLLGDDTNIELLDAARKNQVGFIAQDVQKVIPEVVFYDSITDIYSIDHTKLVPFLVEAIKEQQEIIIRMEAEINKIKSQINNDNTLKTLSVDNDYTDSDSEPNILFQNRPNPFSGSTTIDYFLAKETQNAMINIYDLNGLQLKSIKLIQQGNGNIILNAGELKAGIYIYALIIDNKLIDSKRMVLSN